VNLGTGVGVSVLELVAAYERACGVPIPRDLCARRPGDVATCYADASAATALLGWGAQRSLDEMCEDSWRFERSLASPGAAFDDVAPRGTALAFER
jgi:UDP-glucose 4-epimerase